MIRKRREREGSITVFLSLTLLIIMALLGTMIEVTRGKVCRIQGRRVLRLAADSLMTEYSRPLYEKYNLFFIEKGGTPFPKSIASYAAGTLNPDSLFPDSFNFYDGVLQEVTTDMERYAGDNGGIALQEQIVSYMKRSMAADAVELFLGKTDTLGNMDEKAAEIEQKAKDEKEAAGQCESLLKLMRLVDGVECGNGLVKGEKYFVKKFFYGEKKPGTFGISDLAVWYVMKENVVKIPSILKSIQNDEAKKQEFAKQIQKVESKTREAWQIAKEMGSQLKKMNVAGDAAAVLSSNLTILEQTRELLKNPVTEGTVSELEQLWKDYDTSGITFNYTGIGEKGGKESPMRSFSEAISGGLSKLVLKKGMGESPKKVGDPDHYDSLYADVEREKDTSSDSLNAFTEDEEVDFQGAAGGISKMSATDVMMCQYMKKYFSTVLNQVGGTDKRLDYEWEYILCGKESDQKNLEAVIGRLVLLRSIVNTTALLSSLEKREIAYTAALAVVGFTGMEPLIRFTQTLFLVLWGMAESLVDVAGILQDKKVPLIKGAKDIVVKFPELYQISNEYVMKKAAELPKAADHSFGYPEYLMMLMMGVGRGVRCYRMMDLMEWNIRDHDFSEFHFGGCVDSFRVKGQFSYPAKFFTLPLVQKMIDRQLYDFQQEITVKVSYTGS